MSRIERFDLDAAGKPCSEPPTAELAAGLRLATQDEVDRGGAVQASLEHIANAGT